MNATVENSPGVAEWVKVLRETDKPQATGALHTNKGFCCLGIWCDYLAEKHAFSEIIRDANGFYYYDENFVTLPMSAQEALGAEDENPSVLIDNIHYLYDAHSDDIYEVSDDGITYYRESNPRWLVNCSVAELNDDVHLTFDQIADLVEYAGLG